MKNIAYIRQSNKDIDAGNQRYKILEYTNSNKITNVSFIVDVVSGKKDWKKRKLGEVVDELNAGDNFLVYDFVRMGRSVLDVMEILSVLMRKGVNIHIVKQNRVFKDTIESKALAFALALSGEIEREFISYRTKDALTRLKAEGVQLGKPKGVIQKSKYDEHLDEIKELLNKGVTVSKISRLFFKEKYPYNLYTYLKKRNIKYK